MGMRVAGSLALVLAGLVLGAAAWASPDGGARLYVRPKPVVFGLAFNSQSPLFAGNWELARAINFALDRPALVRAWGLYAGHPTARLLPPGSPGYGTRSPYPLDAAHVDTARLLAADNLRGARATLLVNYGLRRIADEIKVELAQIGLDVVVEISRPCPYACANETPDMFLTDWGADYPDPASTFASFDQRWNGSPRLTPPFRVRLAQARLLSGTAHAHAFAQLDEDVMTHAPPVAPFMAANAAMLVSARTHCFRWNVYYGVDLGALCVK
jgi:ABC-type transport system substrate-binding protein